MGTTGPVREACRLVTFLRGMLKACMLTLTLTLNPNLNPSSEMQPMSLVSCGGITLTGFRAAACAQNSVPYASCAR